MTTSVGVVSMLGKSQGEAEIRLREVCEIVGVGPQSQKSGTFKSRLRPAICSCASEMEPTAANARSAVRCFQVDQGGSRSAHGLPAAIRPSTRPQLCNKLLHNCRHTEATISFPQRGYSSSCRSRRRVSISPRSLVTTSSRSSTVGTSSRMGAGSSRVTR
jgi:hypothetical protein